MVGANPYEVVSAGELCEGVAFGQRDTANGR
jgi:hypothetical protein